MTTNLLGKVSLLGAGPGDSDLLTLKGKRCLETADVILYDELVSGELMKHAAVYAELIYVGKKPGAHCTNQKKIEALLIQKARAGKYVVRLKGGDPFVFGRGGEEAQALRRAGIPFDIVPGVSAVIAAPAYAGIPLTHRDHASSVAIVTGHRAAHSKGSVNWGGLAATVDTLVIVMGVRNLREIMTQLLEGGCAPDRLVSLIQGYPPIAESSDRHGSNHRQSCGRRAVYIANDHSRWQRGSARRTTGVVSPGKREIAEAVYGLAVCARRLRPLLNPDSAVGIVAKSEEQTVRLSSRRSHP